MSTIIFRFVCEYLVLREGRWIEVEEGLDVVS